MDGALHLDNFVFWKFLWGGLHQGIHAPWGLVVWTISLYPQKLHIQIYLMSAQIFFEFPRSLFFSCSNAGIFWQITDFDLICEFEIDSELVEVLNIFTNGIANIKVDHVLNFDMLREAFSSRFFRLDLEKMRFFSPPDKDSASLLFRPFLKESLNRYTRTLKWSLSIDYCIE